MKLYAVKISMPVYFGTYYVLAPGFDDAAAMAMAEETKDGGRNGGIESIEIVGRVEDGEENLLISDTGVAALGLS